MRCIVICLFLLQTYVESTPEKLRIFNSDGTLNESYLKQGLTYQYGPRYTNTNDAVGRNLHGLGYESKYSEGGRSAARYNYELEDPRSAYDIKYKYKSQHFQPSFSVPVHQPILILPQVIPVPQVQHQPVVHVPPQVIPHGYHIQQAEHYPQTQPVVIQVVPPGLTPSRVEHEYYGPLAYDLYGSSRNYDSRNIDYYGYPKKHTYDDYHIADIHGLYEHNLEDLIHPELKH